MINFHATCLFSHFFTIFLNVHIALKTSRARARPRLFTSGIALRSIDFGFFSQSVEFIKPFCRVNFADFICKKVATIWTKPCATSRKSEFQKLVTSKDHNILNPLNF